MVLRSSEFSFTLHLPSRGITHVHQYYVAVRLPAIPLTSSLSSCPSYSIYVITILRNSRASRGNMYPLYDCMALRPRKCIISLAFNANSVLPSIIIRMSAISLIFISRLNHFSYLPPDCQRLVQYITALNS